MSAFPEVQIHYLRPPDRLTVFRQRLMHRGSDGLVSLARDSAIPPVTIHDRVVLDRGASAVWFTFPGSWHDIGRFHRADGTFTGYYANILTPPEFPEEGVWKTTDLFLDVWLPPEGDASLLDEDQFDAAVREGWLDAPTARRARKEADDIMEGIRSGDWPPPIARRWTLERAMTAERAMTERAPGAERVPGAERAMGAERAP